MLQIESSRACNTIRDRRIFIAILTNSNTRSFKVETPKDFHIPKQFWMALFHSLTNLVNLDLALICNDKMLSIIGKSCPKLEYINATSSCKRIKSDFNALLLSRNVSDKGLQHLLGCQYLRKLIIDEPRGKFSHGITYKGLEELLLKLKYLEEINFTDIASIINKSSLECIKLNLKKITQFKISRDKIIVFEKCCPNLRSLELTNFGCDEKETYTSLEYLAESTINLENIKLSYFSYNCAVQKYFQLKGQYLTMITFYGNAGKSIAAEDVYHIGKFCPNLTYLQIEKLAFFDKGLTEGIKKLEMFKHLKTLRLSGLKWDVESILPLCLSHANNIEKISLIINDENYSDYNPYRVQKVLFKILQTNPKILESLRELNLHRPIAVGMRFLKFLFEKCVVLKSLGVWCESEYCFLLEDLIDLENYDIKFQYNLE